MRDRLLPYQWLRRLSLALVTVVASSVPAGAGLTAEQSCQDKIAIAARNYFKTRFKTVAKCEEKRASGKLEESVNCRPATGPVTDTATADKLTKAEASLSSSITAKCGGVDIGGLPLGLPCDQETTIADLVTCLVDDGHGADADLLVESVYDDTGRIDTGSPADDSGLLKCQKKIGQEAEKYASTRMTERRKCGKSEALGKLTDPCPVTIGASLDKARDKFVSKLTDSCTADQVLDAAIDFGFPCDAFANVTFDRDGTTNNNLIPANERLARCMAAAAAGAGDLGADTAYPRPDAAPFSLGVAAGDATDTAFIAWARADGPGATTVEVATDPEFTAIVHTDSLTPDAAADNLVKTAVTGLTPDTQYYYRFSQGSGSSRSGRIRTAPSAGSGDPVTFVWTGDSNAFFRPYNVLDGIVRDDPDMWLYIGDTIYGDDTRSGSGVATTRSEYHAKYRENRDDRALRDVMAGVGTLTIWDDHEVTNDFYGTDPSVAVQLAAGNQAMRDYMPIREDGGDALRLYRNFQWGQAAEFFLIDDRQYRDAPAYVSEPACLDAGEPALLPPAGACQDEIDDPGRTYLGAAQKTWLKDGLLNSTATFKFIMNGPLISPLLFLPYDRWEGFASERQEILDYVETNGIANVIFLSTDIHALIVNDSVSGTSVRELVSGAIGMDPIFRELPASIEPVVPTLPGLFPSVSYFDIDRFNYGLVTVTPTQATVTYKDNTGGVLKMLVIPAL